MGCREVDLGVQVIQDAHAVALGQQAVHQERADKPAPTGDESFGHTGHGRLASWTC